MTAAIVVPVAVALVVIARDLITRIDLVIDLQTDGVQAEISAARAKLGLVID